MTYVRGGDGQPLLCCWDDCERAGHEENKLIRREGDKVLHYVFCSPGHRQYYETSPVSHGNLSRGGPARTPRGILLPS